MKNQKLTSKEATDLDELLEKIKSSGYNLEVNILDEISTAEKNSIYNDYNYKILFEYELIEYHTVGNSLIKISGNSIAINKFIGFVKLYEAEQKERKERKERKQLESSKLTKEIKNLQWQNKNRWWILVISLVGGICGIISLICKCLH